MPQDVSLGEPTPPPGSPYDRPHHASEPDERPPRPIRRPPRILIVVLLALTLARAVSHLRAGEYWLGVSAAATLIALTYFGTRSLEYYEWAASRSRERRLEVGVLIVGIVGAVALSAAVGGPARLAPPAVMLAFCWFTEREFRARPATAP